MTEKTVTEKKRRFTSKDMEVTATFVCDQLKKRKENKKRKDLEKMWKEVDRQVAMVPNPKRWVDEQGQRIPNSEWRTEFELGLQAVALEILTADAKRLMFPPKDKWFRAHVNATDEYLQTLANENLIFGSENDPPSQVNQENADRLLEGALGYVHRQYGFQAQFDSFHAELFKYGTGVGCVRPAKKAEFIPTARGLAKEEDLLPVFYTRPTKQMYLDDTPSRALHEGQVLGPAQIWWRKQKLSDLKMAANRGSKDPERFDGGWMPRKLKDVEEDSDGNVEVIEWEGDLVVERSTTDNLFIPGAIVTVVVAEGKERVIRMRTRNKPFTTYITQPYHVEGVSNPYGTSPLMKGMPIQTALSESYCRIMDATILQTDPPIQYDRDDSAFAQSGGPVVAPGRLWDTLSDTDTVEIGNPVQMMNVFSQLLQFYADQTGMHAPRLGQQTVSHTTAFAKEAELATTVEKFFRVLNIAKGEMELHAHHFLSEGHMERRTRGLCARVWSFPEDHRKDPSRSSGVRGVRRVGTGGGTGHNVGTDAGAQSGRLRRWIETPTRSRPTPRLRRHTAGNLEERRIRGCRCFLCRRNIWPTSGSSKRTRASRVYCEQSGSRDRRPSRPRIRRPVIK